MKIKLIPKGTIRVKRWFAIFPIMIDNEVRWLEYVTVRQEYRYLGLMRFWSNDYFINNQSKDFTK